MRFREVENTVRSDKLMSRTFFLFFFLIRKKECHASLPRFVFQYRFGTLFFIYFFFNRISCNFGAKVNGE